MTAALVHSGEMRHYDLGLVSGVSGLQVDLKEPTPPPLWLDIEVGTEEVRKVVKEVKRHLPPFRISF